MEEESVESLDCLTKPWIRDSQVSSASVGVVSNHRVPKLLKVHTNLVGPTRLGSCFEVAETLKPSYDFVERQCITRSVRIRRYLYS